MFPDEISIPICDRCHSPWENTCFKQNKDEIPLFCRYEIHKTNVYGKKCSKCDNQLIFDGSESCILNMESFLVHHSVLRDYMLHFLHARCTMYAYYKVWSDHMKQMGYKDFEKMMTYCKFRHSWYAFLSLLNIDYNLGFQCTECGDTPDTIVCDATSLSFRKTFVKWESQPNVEDSDCMIGR
ncbi:unnamed protein product [Mytilus edulis]|uniref:HMG domain-containing protein n=1 Tax=Mytilus edulis TaxID=6550 RepID=A0A8S3TUP4_MYTED|nr:unnamed protein product [Mytilus edulis]